MIHLKYRWVLLISIGNIISRGCLALSSSPSPSTTSTTTQTQTQTHDDSQQLPPYLFPNSTPIAPNDISTFQRQTGQIAPSRAAVSIPACCRCRHGFPQAFAMDPVPPVGKKRRINSGMVKLTCPLLVRAVDRLEDDGMIQYYNDRLVLHTKNSLEDGKEEKKEDDDGDYDVKLLRESIWESHKAHATARTNILLHRPTIANHVNKNDYQDDDDDDVLSYVKETLGPNGSKAFFSAGVAGATGKPSSSNDGNDDTTEIDVKCLHAWLADYLFRGEDKSLLGAMVAHRLSSPSKEGGEGELFQGGIKGTIGCHALCDPKGGGGFVKPPPVARNKQRLKGRKERERRKRRRMEEVGEVNLYH